MSNVFWAKLVLKLVVFFASFCWLWDFLLENLKLKRNSDDVRGNVSTNIKKLYAQNNIFKKRIPNMTFWIIYILVQISFLGTALGRLSQCFFFLIFRRWPTMVTDIFTQPPPPTIKKLPTALHRLWQKRTRKTSSTDFPQMISKACYIFYVK